MEAKFIEERRKGLDEFAKRIAEITFLHYSGRKYHDKKY